MSFETSSDTRALQQPTLISHKVHHIHSSRSNFMTTLGSSGIDLPASARLAVDMGRTTDSWASSPYIAHALAGNILGQLDTSLDEDAFHLGYSTSSLPPYSPDQQSPVNGTEVPSYQLYPSMPPISRQQNTYDYSDLRSQSLIESACSNIDPQLQVSTLAHRNPPPYNAYGTRTTSLPSSIHNSPTSTSGHIYGSLAMSASPPRPVQLPRSNIPFYQQRPVQRTAIHAREADSETESQKSTSDACKNRAFLRKGRSGIAYTVCPKQEYKCLYDPKCKVTKQKACDMKDHYYSNHALFNCMQCDDCGNSYARPCTYKRHLKEDKTCPKPRALTTEQVQQGILRKQIMECFGDMTKDQLVKKGVALMKKCNQRQDMRKRKRRVGGYRKQDDEGDEEDQKSTEQMGTDCAGAGSQFPAVNTHHQSYFVQPPSQTYSFHDPNQLFDFAGHNAVPDITPRNCNPTQMDTMFALETFEFGSDLSLDQM